MTLYRSFYIVLISCSLILCTSCYDEYQEEATISNSYLEPNYEIEEYIAPMTPPPIYNDFLLGKWMVTGQTEGFSGQLVEFVWGDYSFEYLDASSLEVSISQNFESTQHGQHFISNAMLGLKSYDYEYVYEPYSQEYIFFSGNEHITPPQFQSPGDNYRTMKYEHKLIIDHSDTLMEIDLGHIYTHGILARISDASIIYLKKF